MMMLIGVFFFVGFFFISYLLRLAICVCAGV